MLLLKSVEWSIDYKLTSLYNQLRVGDGCYPNVVGCYATTVGCYVTAS